MGTPIISWYEGTNKESDEITGVVQYGAVDADSDSTQKTFYVWNNRNGSEDVSKMEEVTFTTRDRLGGTGDTVGNIVEAVRDNWFQVRVDSLDETAFVSVGKGDISSPTGTKELGTTGTTINPNVNNAVTWEASATYDEGVYIKPSSNDQFIYKVTVSGTTGGSEPTWSLTEGNVVTDGTVEYTTIEVKKTPAAQEILGVQNSVLASGEDAKDSGGNFVKFTVFAEVPFSARGGKNLLVKRVSYRYV